MKRMLSFIVAVVALGAAATSALAQAVDLRPKFTVGNDIRLQVSVDDVASADDSPDFTVSSKSDFVIALKPKATEGKGEDAVSVVDLVFERVRMARDDAGTEAVFDSSSRPRTEEDRLLSDALKPLIGATLEVRFDRAGSITSVNAIDSIEAGGPMASITQGLLSSIGLGQLLGPALSIAPPKGSAAPGDKWQTKSETNAGGMGGLLITTNYQFTGMKDGVAQIAFEGKISSDLEKSAPANTSVSLNKSTYRGNFLWDPEQGMVKQMEANLAVVFEQTFTDGSGTKHKTVVKRNAKTRVVRAGEK